MRKSFQSWVLGMLLILYTAKNVVAQVDVCKALLAGGVFDTNRTQTKYSSYNNYRSAYCSDVGSDYGSAKSLDSTATVPIDDVLVGFGLKANASDYNTWHNKLCSSEESLYTSDYWGTVRSLTASAKLVDGFNQCIVNARGGLVQYVTIPSNESQLFSWTIVYSPDGNDATVRVTPNPGNVKCDDLSPGKTFRVGPGGLTLNCSRKDCDSALLSVNASRAPHPSTLTLPAIRLVPDPPPIPHFASITVPMTRPIGDALPGVSPTETCELSSGTGNWNAGPNGALPFSCAVSPQPSVKNGVAASNFDSYYLDNSGTCTFTFKCWQEPSSPHRVLPNWCAK
jgi:hypothetical protein